jgi:hypothetical protein
MYAYYGVLLCCHLVGDFYLQGDKLAKNKQMKVGGVIIHSFVYVLPFLPLIAMLDRMIGEAVLLASVLFVSHFLIDIFSRRYQTFSAFLTDQVMHLVVLLVVARLYPLQIQLPAFWIGIAFSMFFIFKPSSIAVSKLLASCAVTSEADEENALHAGRKIGYLERLIILLLCLFGSVSACTLVIAAKTLVRYSEFSNDNNFREVFLVGTLMSITLALIGYGGARLLMG